MEHSTVRNNKKKGKVEFSIVLLSVLQMEKVIVFR